MQQHFRFFAGLALLTVLFAAPGLVLAHGEGSQQTVDGYTVTLALPEKGFFTGRNPLAVSVWDWQGNTPEATVSLLLLAYTPSGGGHGDHGAEDDHGATELEADDHGHVPTDGYDATEPEADDHGASDNDHGSNESEDDDHGHAPADEHDAPKPAADEHGASDDGHDHSGEDALEGRGLDAIPVALAPGHELGEFVGELAFDEAGTYSVSVVFTIDGEEHGAIFDVEVAQSRPRGLVLGGFALVNALAIGSAAFLKWRSPAKPARKPARPAPAAPSAEEPSK